MSDGELENGFYGDDADPQPTAVGDGSAMLDMSILMADPEPESESDERLPDTSPLEDPALSTVADSPAGLDGFDDDFDAEVEAELAYEPTRGVAADLAEEATAADLGEGDFDVEALDNVDVEALGYDDLADDDRDSVADDDAVIDRDAEDLTESTDEDVVGVPSGLGDDAPAVETLVNERWSPPESAEVESSLDERPDPNPFANAAPRPHNDDAESIAPGASDPDALEGVAELERIIDGRLVTMMYQPITSLLDDSVVGYEALARGPEGSPLAAPAEMFTVAQDADRIRDLDLLCQDQAVMQARDVLLKSGHALFMNVEATVLKAAAFGLDPEAETHFASLLENITAACPVVLEISDLDSFSSTAELLGVAMWARRQGFRVALDDIGVSPRSLSILPLIEPDVIKLQRGITSASPDADLGELLSVIRSQSERTGAAVVVPGIESEEERQVALSFGATHVQGFAIGHPEELSDAPLRIRSLEPVGASWGEPCTTPFELVANSSQVRTGTEELMLALTLDLERQARNSPNSVILSSFERTIGAPAAIASRYEELAESCGFVVALGPDLHGMPGVFSGDVDAADKLAGEPAIVVMTPQFSAALIGRIAGGGDGDRSYAYALIYDRGQVTRAARMLTGYVEL